MDRRPRPVGYNLEASCLVVNAEEADRVRRIFEWYLEGQTVYGIVAKCADLGWHNKQWTTKDGKLYGGHPMRKCHVYKMLANPLYAARIRADDEVVAANHARTVDDRTFDLVQEKLKENTRNPGTQHRPRLESLLRGLLYCTCCGSAMSPSYSSSKQRRYRYYVCIRATQRNGEGCTTRAVSAPVVEEAVIESIRHFVLAPEVVEEAARAARQRLTEELNRHREELKAVNVRVRNAKSQLARATTMDAEREAALRDLIAAGDAKAEELRKAVARGERLRFDDSMVRQHLGNFDQVWTTMTIEEQVRLLRQLVERVGYDARGDGGRCDHCPQDRLDAAQASERGLVIRRALDLMCALKLGVRISLDDIRADELAAMLIIAEERDLLDREKLSGNRHGR